MSPGEVIQASNGAASWTSETQRKNKNRPPMEALVWTKYASDPFKFDVDFNFSDKKLTLIELTLTPYIQCEELKDALLAKYRPPSENKSDRAGIALVWNDRDNKNVVRIFSIAMISECGIIYRKLESANGL